MEISIRFEFLKSSRRVYTSAKSFSFSLRILPENYYKRVCAKVDLYIYEEPKMAFLAKIEL